MYVSQPSNQSAWKQAYQEALFEVDQIRLQEPALEKVEDRLFEVRSDPTNRREIMELQDAKTHDSTAPGARATNPRNSKMTLCVGLDCQYPLRASASR